MFPIKKYGITLRLVEESDAAFILKLRMDKEKSKYISATNPDIEQQQAWIKKYKTRELEGLEYYFIAEDENGTPFSTYRVYDIKSDSVVIGSWVSLPGYSNANNSIKVDIAVKEFVFTDLGFNTLLFDVRRKNKSVLRYHKLYNPTIIRESDEDIFFQLTKEDFFEKRVSLFKNI